MQTATDRPNGNARRFRADADMPTPTGASNSDFTAARAADATPNGGVKPVP